MPSAFPAPRLLALLVPMALLGSSCQAEASRDPKLALKPTIIRAQATDAQGNSYFGGEFSKELALDGQRLAASGLTNLYLARFSPKGKCLWARRLGGAQEDDFLALSITPDGKALVLGRVHSAPTPPGVANPQDPLMVSAFTPEGAQLWSAKVAEVGYFHGTPGVALAAGADGGAAVAASYLDVGSDKNGRGFERAFIRLQRLSAAGTLLWEIQVSAWSQAAVQALHFQPGGDLEATGTTSGSLSIGGCSLERGGSFAVVVDATGKTTGCRVTGEAPKTRRPSGP